jgi:hypothetical protein
MSKYTFEKLWEELDNGYIIKYDYLGDTYKLTKLTKNCYAQELLKAKKEKHSIPNRLVITLRRVKEIFDFMENIEYIIS